MGTHFSLVHGPGLGRAGEIRARAGSGQCLMGQWRTQVKVHVRPNEVNEKKLNK